MGALRDGNTEGMHRGTTCPIPTHATDKSPIFIPLLMTGERRRRENKHSEGTRERKHWQWLMSASAEQALAMTQRTSAREHKS